MSKSKVIVEPADDQDAFEAARKEYTDTIGSQGSCILLAVYRGKMSEGVSFNDENARGVICVGVPFPHCFDRSITAKKAYNDEQRLLRKLNLLPGDEWYKQQAYRALAQALGRCTLLLPFYLLIGGYFFYIFFAFLNDMLLRHFCRCI